MNRQKLYKKTRFILLALVVISLLLVSTFGAIQSTDTLSNDAYAAVPQGTASILNLNNKGAYIDNFTGALKGAQNEYIYFGVMPGTTTPVVWRVLSTNDTKYSQNGGILLWADDVIGKGEYNEVYQDTQEHAFWGTSKMRAMLNGGDRKYVKGATGSMTGVVTDAESWLFKIFDAAERGCVKATDSYETRLFGYKGTHSSGSNFYYYYTDNLIGSGDGYYTNSKFGTANTSAQYAKAGANNSVVETTSGDYLFLLDYYDINNKNYGFTYSDGKTYADKVMQGTWNDTGSYRGYPGYYDYGNNGNTKVPDSLASTRSYWLRPAGRISSTSGALYVDYSGFVNVYYVHGTVGVRPGFIFNPESVIYATTSTAGNDNTFSLVNTINNSIKDKPAYKVYMQSTNYTNYNLPANMANAPQVAVGNGKITVTKNGQTGSAIVLLANKNNSGAVEYQATATFNGNGVATIAIPSGLNVHNYDISVLFLDKINGNNSVEKVTASYTGYSLAIPQSMSIGYLGRNIKIDDFANEDWYDANVYEGETKKIEVNLSGVRDVKENGYTITFTIVDDNLRWTDGTKDATITLTITKATLTLAMTEHSNKKPDVSISSGLKGEDIQKPPEISLWYTGSNSDGNYNSEIEPTKVGRYTATAQVKNSNYVLDKPYTSSFEIKPTLIKVPTLASNNRVVYSGSNIDFFINDFDERMTYEIVGKEGGVFDGTKLTATNAGTYTIKFSLSNNIETNWDDAKNPQGIQSIEVTILEKNITIQFDNDIGKWYWFFDENKEVKITPSGVMPGEVVTLDVTCNDEILTTEVRDGITYVVISGLSQGDYTLKARLNANASVNANYKIEGTFAVQEFTLKGKSGDFQKSDILWQYTNDGKTTFIGNKEYYDALIYNGKPFEISLDISELANKGVKVIEYGGNISATDVGDSYVATVKIGPLNGDYDIEVQTFTLRWKINKRQINLPNEPEGFIFNDEERDIATFFGLQSDYSEYLSYSTTKDGSVFSGTAIKYAGIYQVTFALLSGNVEWSDGEFDDVSRQITISPLVLELVEWAKKIPEPKFSQAVESKYFEVVYKDVNGVVIPSNEIRDHRGETCTVTVQVPNSMIDSVIINDIGGVGFVKEFVVAEGQAISLPKPTLSKTEFVFSGSQIDISQFVAGFEKNFMAKEGDVVATNTGNYKLIISLLKTVNAEWDDGTTNNIEFEWSITKATLAVAWNTKGKVPVLKLDGLPENAVEYIFYDEKNEEISRENLVLDSKYTVVARLTEEYAENYVFDETDSDFTIAKAFTYKNTSSAIDVPDDFPLWQAIVGGVAILLGMIFYGRTISNAKKTRKYKKDAKAVDESYAEDIDKQDGYDEDNKKLYAVSGLPILMLAETYFGLEQNVWTIIACALLGVCLVGFFSMLVTGHSCKKARVVYETALVNRDAELERRREGKQRQSEERFREEQRRREEELKMVLVAMMGNRGNMNMGGIADGLSGYQPSGIAEPYNENVEEIVTRVVTALLPNVQALPASNDDTKKIIEQQAKIIEELQNRVGDDEDEDFYDDEWTDDEDTEQFVTDDVPLDKSERVPSNFRIRLKLSSDKNRSAYVLIKNKINSFRHVSFRMSGRIEKVMYKGEPLMYIGVVRKSLKLWLALDPNEFDAKRYFQRDASDKVRYQKVPMLVRVGSDRALKRAEELIEILAAQYGLELRRKYSEKSLQELAYTLKGNALVKDKMPELLREVIHIHDADILTNEDAERYTEIREKLYQAEENFATISIDVLEENFYDGQKVTLEKLQKKGLVAEECNGYRLTAGERLTKPLYVVADEFAPTAVKMIVLTGGRAIQFTEQFVQII